MTVAIAPTTPKPKRYIVRDQHGQVVGHAELREVPVHVIKIDPDYQRDQNQHWVSQHMPYDRQRAGALILSSRSGGPYCLDGGHRLALARASGVEKIAALVIDGLAKADEARLFTQYQRERRNLQSFDLFRADQVAGDPDTLAIVRIVHNNGFTLAKKNSTRGITAIDGLRYIHRLGGDDLLNRTLALVKSMWLEEDKALSGQVLKGLAIFLAHAGNQPAFRRERLERVMAAAGPAKLVRLAQAVADRKRRLPGSRPADVADALLEQYNKITTSADEKLPVLTIGGRKAPGERK